MVSKSKKDQSLKKVIYLLGAVIIVLIVLLAALVVKKTGNDYTLSTQKGINISLGSYEWVVADNKTVKQTDSKTVELKKFLTTESMKILSENCKQVYHWVIGSSADRNQVLLSYGCDNPGARMFAVNNDKGWSFISPTNQFDSLGIPLCTHVDQNNIDKTIAPVCYDHTSSTDEPLVYKTR